MAQRIPHPIDVTVTDVDKSTKLSGATVTVYDREKSDSVTAVETTDSNGVALVDMANMTEAYAPGDNIAIEAVKGNKIKQAKTTIIGDAQSQSLTMEYTDAVGAILEILSDNWQKERTDNILPIIDYSFHHKDLDLANNDYILDYEISEIIDPFSLGGKSFQEITGVSLDTSTTFKVTTIEGVRPHLMKIREEIKRILKSKIGGPALPFQLLVPRRVKDMSNKGTGLGRFVADYDLKFWGTG